jgi:hypothetical protein
MALVNLSPKNKIEIDLLTTENAVANGDEFIFNDVSAAVPKTRKTSWSNLISLITTALSASSKAAGETASTGDLKRSLQPTITGWVKLDGTTIGSAASGATGRANADTQALFTLIWEQVDNTYAVIQDSSGSPTTRGASASADFAANKRIPLFDGRNRYVVAVDPTGTTGRITTAGSGIDGTKNGATGGSQNVTLLEANLPAHTHDVDVPATTAASAATGTDVATPGATAPETSTSVGSATPVVVLPPTGVYGNLFQRL